MDVKKHRRWLVAFGCVLLLVFGLFLIRERLKRGAIAVMIYRAHIFTSPPRLPKELWGHRLHEEVQFYWDIAGLHVARETRVKLLNPTLRPLVKEIDRRQAAGENMQYSMHIYREVRWWLNFTPDVATTRERIDDLRRSLNNAAAQKQATEQQPDGSWARGINVWYLKLYYSVDQIKECNNAPQYPLSFLDRINSPKKLTAQLDADLHNDFTRTDVFNREELDETFSALARLLYSSRVGRCYAFDPQLKDALKDFVTGWQNPATGCWGQWMVDREGRIWKMDDMGMTFHVVSDLHGEVAHQDLIAKRLLELDRTNFPTGILFNGHYENHLNMDAVKIFRSAWPSLDDATRQRARAEISRMLNWCLTKSLQPDGSFKVSDLDDTVSDAYRYGVWFLQETGYFQRKDRFWTDQDFPEAKAKQERIEAKLRFTGLNDSGLREAYDTLRAME
jgi:hypothetical protein